MMPSESEGFPKNIKLVLAYDGTHYQGWQRGSSGKSIEEVLEKVLVRLCQHPLTLQAASRTDAGVHAEGQVVNFFTPKDLNLSQFLWSLNQLLPKDLKGLKIEIAEKTFHPTLSAVSKEYRYYICNSAYQLPQHRHYSWHVHKPLNVERVEAAMRSLEGTHDFTSFCNHHVGNSYADHIRNLFSFTLHPINDCRFYLAIRGDHFLYKMVRNLVGTVVDIGIGKMDLSQLPEILLRKDRRSAGFCAPAHGLFLHEITYAPISIPVPVHLEGRSPGLIPPT